MSHKRMQPTERPPSLSCGHMSQHLIEVNSGICHAHSLCAPTLSPWTPFNKVVGGDTWSLLHFKWLTLMLPFSAGGEALAFCSVLRPVFPQNLQADSPWYVLSCMKHWKPDTPLSPSRPKGSEHAGRSSFNSHVWPWVYLKEQRQVQACQSSCNFGSSGSLVCNLYRPSFNSNTSDFWADEIMVISKSRDPTE